MKSRSIRIPDLVLIGGTRIALGLGIGLLLARYLSKDARKGAGAALVAVGGLTTIPLMLNVFSGAESELRAGPMTWVTEAFDREETRPLV